jgi:hypothetical protein
MGNLLLGMDNQATTGELCSRATRWFDRCALEGRLSAIVSMRFCKGPTPPPQTVLPVGSVAAPRTASTRRRAHGTKTASRSLTGHPRVLSRRRGHSPVAHVPLCPHIVVNDRLDLPPTPGKRSAELLTGSNRCSRRQTPPPHMQCYGRDNRLSIGSSFTAPPCSTSPGRRHFRGHSPRSPQSLRHFTAPVRRPFARCAPSGEHSLPRPVLLPQPFTAADDMNTVMRMAGVHQR